MALERIADALESSLTPPSLKITLQTYIRSGPSSSMVRDVLTLLADMPECSAVQSSLLEGVATLAGS